MKLNESFSFHLEHICAGVLFFTSINTSTHLFSIYQTYNKLNLIWDSLIILGMMGT